MKAHIIAAIERIAGDRLTLEMCDAIADETISIISTINRTTAIAAIETVKEKLESINIESPLTHPLETK